VRHRAHGGVGGLVLLDKPAGPSSFRAVREVGRALGLKAGHAGTLDPRASGLLLVLVGQSTRLVRYLVGLDKRYVTDVQLGARTSTGDAEGAITERTEVPDDVEAEVAALVGELELRVPAASAVRIDGERAYRLHRSGVDVEMPMRCSTVHAASVLDRDGTRVRLDLQVSSGTYIRAIADLLGGHCVTLRRTEVGPFDVADASPERVIPPRDALPFLPEIELDDDAAARLVNGRDVPCPLDGLVRLTYRGSLVAVSHGLAGRARPETVLKGGFPGWA
jgi:tRNA pseudouridine55 synthase